MHPLLAINPSPIRRLLIHLEETMTLETVTTTQPTEYVVARDTARITLVVDPGNSLTAWLAVDSDGVVSTGSFPSVLSLRGANSTRLLRERGEDALRDGEYVVRGVDGLDVYVGRLAYDADAWANTRGSADRYSDANWNLYLFYTAAALAAPYAKRITANMITMVPPGLWADQQSAVKTMLTRKEGHSYTFNGREIKLNVSDVTVEREGQVAWYALPEDQRTEGLSLIFDWGGGTINALLVDGDGTSERKPQTFDKLGLETVLDDLSADLPRPLTVMERENLKASLAVGLPMDIYINGGSVEITVIALARIDQAARQIGAIIKPKFSSATLNALRHIYLIGGTAHVATTAMRSVFSRIEVPTRFKPELLNVLGAAFKAGAITAAPDGVLVPAKKRGKK